MGLHGLLQGHLYIFYNLERKAMRVRLQRRRNGGNMIEAKKKYKGNEEETRM
jgi:hypothetical protein